MANDLVINPKTIFTELQKLIPQMKMALPVHMNAERMARIALTQLRVTPKLMSCTPESFYASLMVASQIGLEPGIQGQCYLIPYKNTCALVPGWRGYMDLLSRTGRASAWTNAVYDGDEFDYEYGDKPFIHHKPGKWSGKEAAMEFAYAVGRQKESEWPVIEVWDIGKINAHRDKNNKVGQLHYSYVHPEMYARKIPLLQVLKYLPSSVELANAAALDVAASEGKQKLTIDLAVTGALESGGDTSEPEHVWPEDQEVDDLIAKLSLPRAQIDLIRRENGGNREELLKILRKRLPVEASSSPSDSQAEASPRNRSRKNTSDVKPTLEPETKAEPEPEAKPESQVEEKKEEPTPDPKPEPKPEVKQEAKASKPSAGTFDF